jgi:hypothetical protein
MSHVLTILKNTNPPTGSFSSSPLTPSPHPSPDPYVFYFDNSLEVVGMMFFTFINAWFLAGDEIERDILVQYWFEGP